MHFTSALVASCVGTLVAASPADLRPRHADGKLVAHRHDRINLDHFGPSAGNDTSLEKRVWWDICWRSVGHTGNCLQGAAVGIGAIFAIATLTKDNSDNHDCSYHNGQSGDVAYQLHATGEGGCSTSAEEGTIAGGLQGYFDANNGQICEVRCLDQTHGGSYDGYLLIGPRGEDLSQYKCDASIDFPKDDSCTSGGKKDAP